MSRLSVLSFINHFLKNNNNIFKILCACMFCWCINFSPNTNFTLFASNICEARLCNTGAENFYSYFINYINRVNNKSNNYHHTLSTLEKDENDNYTFWMTTKNRQTNVSAQYMITIYPDMDGYVKSVGFIGNPKNSNTHDMCISQNSLTFFLGINQQENKYLWDNIRITECDDGGKLGKSSVYCKRANKKIYAMIKMFPNGNIVTMWY